MLPGFYRSCQIGVRILLLLLTRCQLKGKENVPAQGPLLIVSNHINLTDPIIIGAVIDRKVAFMAKEGLFRSKFSRFFMRNLGAFPVHRGRVDVEALRQALQVMAEGKALLMFPEGRRSQNSQLQSALLGSALIASRSGALILPIGISGTENIRGVAWLLHLPRITINIGCPFSLPPVSGRLTKEKRAELTRSIMSRIAGLLSPEYHGDYAERVN